MKTTEYGGLLCPIPGCKRELFLNRQASIPLYKTGTKGEHAQYGTDYDARTSDSWAVQCERGHVLMKSTAEEGAAEPFELEVLEALVQAIETAGELMAQHRPAPRRV